jgi:hypothetical protein
MDIGSILLLLTLVVVVAGIIFKPFRDGGPAEWEEDLELSGLLSERERILESLAELDFDNELGKVPEEIYELQRKYLLTEGAEVMKRLEEEYPAETRTDTLEEQISARREKVKQTAEVDDPLEEMIRQRRAASAKPEKTAAKPAGKAKFCPECGQPVVAGDRFCTSCGTKL